MRVKKELRKKICKIKEKDRQDAYPKRFFCEGLILRRKLATAAATRNNRYFYCFAELFYAFFKLNWQDAYYVLVRARDDYPSF